MFLPFGPLGSRACLLIFPGAVVAVLRARCEPLPCGWCWWPWHAATMAGLRLPSERPRSSLRSRRAWRPGRLEREGHPLELLSHSPRSRTRPSHGDCAALALRVQIRAPFLCVGEGFLMPRVHGHAPPVMDTAHPYSVYSTLKTVLISRSSTAKHSPVAANQRQSAWCVCCIRPGMWTGS